MINHTSICLFFLFITFSLPICAQEYHTSMDVRLFHTPKWVTIAGKPTVYYELHLTNFAADTLQIVGLDISQGSDSLHLRSFTADALASQMAMKGADNLACLSPGSAAVVYLELELALVAGRPPDLLNHRFIYEKTVAGKQESRTVDGPAVSVSPALAVTLGAPLNGGPWIAVSSPVWERGHRRVFYTQNGQARIPGRFAIDFLLLDNQGKLAMDDQDSLTNWFGFGVDVLAVADATVVSCRNDFQESNTLSAHTQPTAEQATGNYICLRINSGTYVFYEHLKLGSLRVEPGQQVKKGEVIASLGFTGQTSQPHLHFHVADAPSALGAEGLPFTFEAFELLGSFPDVSKLGRAPWIPNNDNQTKMLFDERPGSNTVIRFD